MPAAPLRLAYALQKWLWRVVRPQTRGVKVMLFNDKGELMLIRNTYGRSDLFVLPGGGIHPFESPSAAARREIREELSCGVDGLAQVATFTNASEGKRDTIFLFEGRIIGGHRWDDIEVAEARFVSLEALPNAVSPATRRRIDEHRGKRKRDGCW